MKRNIFNDKFVAVATPPKWRISLLSGILLALVFLHASMGVQYNMHTLSVITLPVQYHRCIKLFSTKHNISGCIDTNGTFSVTPAMAALGLMDVFSLPPGSAGAVVLHRDRSSLYTLLHNAMLIAVADVPFLNNTVVKYHHLLIFGRSE